MELFNIICGICSIGGLLVSLFTAGKVIRISKIYDYNNKEDHSKTINKNKNSTYRGPYTGRDCINGVQNREQK